MSLEQFRRTRMVILTRHSKIYQAARAMANRDLKMQYLEAVNRKRPR